MMASIILLAIGVVIMVALLGSAAIQILTTNTDDGLSPLEQKCQKIVNEGYKIHTMYPNSNPEDLPESDRDLLLQLDEKWIKECVNVLSAESIFSIVNNVERDFLHGE